MLLCQELILPFLSWNWLVWPHFHLLVGARVPTKYQEGLENTCIHFCLDETKVLIGRKNRIGEEFQISAVPAR